MTSQIAEALQKLDVMLGDASAHQAQQAQRAVVTSAAAAPVANGAPATAAGEDHVASIRAELASLFTASIAAALPAAEGQSAIIAPCNNPAHGDYQCNNAMALFGRLKGKVGGVLWGTEMVGGAGVDNGEGGEVLQEEGQKGGLLSCGTVDFKAQGHC